MMLGFYIVMSRRNLVKKVVGLGIFQNSVFLLYLTMERVKGGTAPILDDRFTSYSNPLPSVLILTAIVVGVATTAVAFALIVRIQEAYGTIEEDEIEEQDREEEEREKETDARGAATAEAGGRGAAP
jgi:multicomponent Na+:H+ antiporter subunit C